MATKEELEKAVRFGLRVSREYFDLSSDLSFIDGGCWFVSNENKQNIVKSKLHQHRKNVHEITEVAERDYSGIQIVQDSIESLQKRLTDFGVEASRYLPQ